MASKFYCDRRVQLYRFTYQGAGMLYYITWVRNGTRWVAGIMLDDDGYRWKTICAEQARNIYFELNSYHVYNGPRNYKLEKEYILST